MSAQQQRVGVAIDREPAKSRVGAEVPNERPGDVEPALAQHQDAVIEALELLHVELGSSVPSRHTLDTALREARRATKLARRLTEMSASCGESRLCELLVSSAMLAMERSPERLRIVVPSPLPEVVGDLALIQNIVTHTIKRAAGPGANVEISARPLPAGATESRLAGAAVVVRVESVALDGKRVDPSRAKVEELRIVIGEDAVSESGAHLIGYTSADAMHRFELHLPTPEIRRPTPVDWREGHRALVVGGDPTLVRCMHEMLGYLGWEVDIASGGSGTLAVYERARRAGRPYGLVILDARSTEESSEIHGFARAVRHDVEVRMVLCADDADEAAADAAADESHIFDAHLWRPFRCVDVHRMLG